jgi:hypothetical protein
MIDSIVGTVSLCIIGTVMFEMFVPSAPDVGEFWAAEKFVPESTDEVEDDGL